MAAAVEGGGAIAWRVLATLEGGAALLATSVLLALTARGRRKTKAKTVSRVLLTNTTSDLGTELKQKLESHGCTVTSGAGTEAGTTLGKVDALIIVGAESVTANLDGMADLVTEDIHNNLKILDSLSRQVRRGGYLTWVSVGTATGPFSGAINAFDTALKASLHHTAKMCDCEALWIGRCESASRAVEQIIAKLIHTGQVQQYSAFSIRNAASKASNYIGRWLKIIT